jgi:hypothetical protein
VHRISFLRAVAVRLVVGLAIVAAVIVLDTLALALLGVRVRLVVIALVGLVAIIPPALRARRPLAEPSDETAPAEPVEASLSGRGGRRGG